MADSYVTHTGNATAGPFSFAALDYLSADHLVVRVDGISKTVASHYTVSGTAVTFTAGNFPAAATVIKIERVTPRSKATRLVDFENGAVLTESDLDTAHLQNLYIAQESFETTAGTLAYDESLAAYTADSKEIKVLADPTTDASAVHRKYVTDVASFGVPGIPQQYNTTITDGSTQFTLVGWDNVSQNMTVVALDGVVQIPGTDFTVVTSGSDTVLTLVGITPPNPTVLNVQNFGVSKSSTTLADDSVTTDKIVDSAVTNAKLAGWITSDKLADDAATEAKIANDAVDFLRLKDVGFTTAPGGGTDHALMIDKTTGNLSDRDIVTADINDFNTVLNAKPISTFTAATGNVNMGDGVTNYKISNTLDPTSDQDVATKAYVDARAAVGATAEVSTTITNLKVYSPAASSDKDTKLVTTIGLPSEADRVIGVHVTWDPGAASDNLATSEGFSVALKAQFYKSDDATLVDIGSVVYGPTVAKKTAGSSDDPSNYNKSETLTAYPTSDARYARIYLYSTENDGGDSGDYIQLSAVLGVRLSYISGS
jgi:hypothetical protein